MILTVSSLIGTEAELSFAIGILLQASLASGRAFLPPLKGGVYPSDKKKGQAVVRYIWSLFPVSHWSGKAGNFETILPKSQHRAVDIAVLEPLYIPHAVGHLKTAYQKSVKTSMMISELSDTLWLDVSTTKDYADLLKRLSQPFFSTTLVVTLENLEAVATRPGWHLQPDFESLEPCSEMSTSTGGEGTFQGGKAVCGRLCSRKSSTM